MKDIKIGSIYRHYNGNYYIIEGIGIHSENLEECVIYRGLYGNNQVWIRPLDMFFDEVNKNGQKYRFELQKIESKDPNHP